MILNKVQKRIFFITQPAEYIEYNYLLPNRIIALSFIG